MAELEHAEVAPVPEGNDAASTPVAVTPHGQTFDAPVTITLTYDPIPGMQPVVLRLDDEADTTREVVPDTRFELGTASFESTHFSVMTVAQRAETVTGDGGVVEVDAGPGDVDAGSPAEEDAGAPAPTDAGSGDVDGGGPGEDAGIAAPIDAGIVEPIDAGPDDVDAGGPGEDAGSGL